MALATTLAWLLAEKADLGISAAMETLRNLGEGGHRFWRNPATHSDRSRPPPLGQA
jgi:hypothetical protein